jgi:3-hydroxybutyryl-CoA dehydrogenase
MIIGICGGGTMGAGIALVCLQAGHTVIVYDSFDGVEERCKDFLDIHITKAVEKGKFPQARLEDLWQHYRFTTALADLSPCELVIEAIVEDRAAKQALLQALEESVSEHAILASNTSSISITALAAALRHPRRCVGMHFFNPAHLMKLVEVIRGVKTAPEVVDAIVQLTRQLGKTPARASDVPGFIVNRVARSFYLESMRLVEEGAVSVKQTDDILCAAGFKMGPFELVDLIGIDTNYAVTLSVWEQYFREPRFAPSLLQKQYVDAGLYGRKSGEGFYDYTQ